jgi:general secretion pathway protein B
MSYILDALRRADSERERTAIPSIHAQPVPRASADLQAHAGPRPWVWVVVGVLVVVLGQGAWQLLRSPQPEPARHAAAGGTAPEEATAPPPTAGDAPAAGSTEAPAGAALPGIASTDAAQAALPAFPPPDPPAPRTATAPPAQPAARKPPPQPRAAVPTPEAPAPAAATVPPPPAEAPVLQDPVYAMAELPPDVRQALPRLQVGGSVYSEDPGSRFVILNGLIFHENDKPAAGVLLERIELKSAVLSFRGYRFRLSF